MPCAPRQLRLVPNPDLRRRRGCDGWDGSRLRIDRLEQCLCFLKIGRVEAFVEPGIDWREDVTGFGTATLRAQQASEADGIAQLVGARTLLLRDGERPAGTSFDSGRVGRGKRWSKSPRNRWSSELAPRAPLNTTSNGLIRAAGTLGKMPMQTSLDALPLVKENSWRHNHRQHQQYRFNQPTPSV
jgi:hypothetical protein